MLLGITTDYVATLISQLHTTLRHRTTSMHYITLRTMLQISGHIFRHAAQSLLKTRLSLP